LPVNDMTISEQEQDTVKQDSVRISSDSVARQNKISADTTSVCTRNTISDITFYDPNNLINRLDPGVSNSFPVLFIEKNIEIQNDERVSLMRCLREGRELPVRPFHENWILLVILFAAFLFSVIRTFSKKLFPDVVKFFLFRGIGSPVFRDTGILFHWQSTILNLISFINLALFGYYAAFFYDIIPLNIPGVLFWLIILGVIIAIITIRHIICVITGIISGERKTFNEYLQHVYLFYRFSALILFVLVILMTFTVFYPAKFFFITGLSVMLLIYIIRIIRLLIIFLSRNISIFYFILYLCALEILPAMVSVKYLTGFF
jgi:hypothetical protein